MFMAAKSKIASLRAKMKKESQFNRKMELNMEIQKRKREKENIKAIIERSNSHDDA